MLLRIKNGIKNIFFDSSAKNIKFSLIFSPKILKNPNIQQVDYDSKIKLQYALFHSWLWWFGVWFIPSTAYAGIKSIIKHGGRNLSAMFSYFRLAARLLIAQSRLLS